MASPIQQFYTVAQNRDFARLFQFRLVQFGNIEFDVNHFAYAESASLPGRQITNIPVTYMGLDFNTPGTVKYPGSTSYQVQFRCDQNYNIRAALEASTFQTFDESTSTGTYGVPGESSKLIMELFDKQMNTVRTYTLFGVWVQGLGDVNYDVKDVGSVQTIQATIAYQYWRASDYAYGGAPHSGALSFRSTNPALAMITDGTKNGYVQPTPWGARRTGA
jgi:hypothetical protein